MISTSLITRKILPLMMLFSVILLVTYLVNPKWFMLQVENIIINGPVLILAFTVGGYISNKIFLHDVEERFIRAFKTIMADRHFQQDLKAQFDLYLGDYAKIFKKEAEAYILEFAKVIKREVIGDDDEETPSSLTPLSPP